jgi:hypothetical protein
MYFRFYDPRVLLSYLHSGTPDEVGQFLASFTQVLIPTPAGEFESITPAVPPPSRSTAAVYPVRLRQEQVDAMGQPLAVGFLTRMSERARDLFPDRAERFSQEELEEFLNDHIQDATRHGIDEEPDVEAFLDLCLNFDRLALPDRDPVLAEILRHPTRSGGAKIEMLRDRLVF